MPQYLTTPMLTCTPSPHKDYNGFGIDTQKTSTTHYEPHSTHHHNPSKENRYGSYTYIPPYSQGEYQNTSSSSTNTIPTPTSSSTLSKSHTHLTHHPSHVQPYINWR